MAAYYVDKPNMKILGCLFIKKTSAAQRRTCVSVPRNEPRDCGAMLRLRAAAAASLAGFTRAGATLGGLTPLARRSPLGALRSLTVRALAPPRIDGGKLPAGRKAAPARSQPARRSRVRPPGGAPDARQDGEAAPGPASLVGWCRAHVQQGGQAA